MKKNNKLQELVSNQIANAIETVKENATSQVTNNQKKEGDPKTVKAPKKSTTPKSLKVTKEVVKQQNAAILEQVISTREVKYLYPEEVVDTLARKRWRQQTRNELHKLEREVYRIKDTNSKEYKEALQAFKDYQAKVLKPAQSA